MDIPRYLVDINPEDVEKIETDVVIIGSGIAGIYTALRINPGYRVAILTKETLEISNSVLAQGGIAVSLGKDDSPELHFEDTLYAGAGLCNEKAVWVLVNEARENITRLCEYGVNFDKQNDRLLLSREAAHSKNRIIHAGDTTGKEVCDTLISIVRTRENIHIHERTFALDLLTDDRNRCAGVYVFDEDEGKYKLYLSKVVICAAGGYGQLYESTTNPQVTTGDGVCLAYRAGASLKDIEFIQFHPTVLYHPENKSFLITEAVRGEGGILRNIHGEPFMANYHPLKELAPRDVVSRAIFSEMKKTGSDHVYLDITFREPDWIEKRFPNIFKTCLEYGIDIRKDYIPVAPAEHYCMGGIKTDMYGRTNIPGFYACGEAACTGVHGANRLASNSLLEGLVFGNRISQNIDEYISNSQKPRFYFEPSVKRVKKAVDSEQIIKTVKRIMTKKVGIVRHFDEMQSARNELEEILGSVCYMENRSVKDFEMQNIVLLSYLVVQSAILRTESRGAHYRTDYPETDNKEWKKNIVVDRKGVGYEP